MTLPSFIGQAEQSELFRRRSNVDHAGAVFRAWGSSGANPKRLAQFLTTLDLAFCILSWDKPIIKTNEAGQQEIVRPALSISALIEARQASIDARYHDDYVKIAVADEIVRKRRIRYTPEQQMNNEER